MEDTAPTLALPGIADRVMVAAAAVEGKATAALALLAELTAARDRGDHVAGLMGRVADLDGMRAALTAAITTCGTEQAALIMAIAREKHRHGWEDREEAAAAHAPPPALRAVAGG